MFEVLKKSECTGCGACKDICPKNAIQMVENERGFKYPVIDSTKCIDCTLCQQTCPMLGDREVNRPIEIIGMKHNNKEIRKQSTSGGAFTLIAERILSENGSVYGVAFDDTWKVGHIRVTDKKDLERLRKSKYVQSDLGDSYVEVEADIRAGKKVLFSGTACQCNGLKNYLVKRNVDTSNLFLCDLICHGVPSPKIWRDYISYRQKKYGTLKAVDFRDKQRGWRDFKLSFIDEKGKKRWFRQSDDYFFILFFHNYILREACHSCKYTSIERISDFTIGDFWGVEENYKEFSDDEGISVLLVNSEKGNKLLASEKDKIACISVSPEACILRQPNLRRPTPKNPKGEAFWKDYVEYGFDYVIKKYADGTLLGQLKRKYVYKLLYKLGIFQLLLAVRSKLVKKN